MKGERKKEKRKGRERNLKPRKWTSKSCSLIKYTDPTFRSPSSLMMRSKKWGGMRGERNRKGEKKDERKKKEREWKRNESFDGSDSQIWTLVIPFKLFLSSIFFLFLSFYFFFFLSLSLLTTLLNWMTRWWICVINFCSIPSPSNLLSHLKRERKKKEREKKIRERKKRENLQYFFAQRDRSEIHVKDTSY